VLVSPGVRVSKFSLLVPGDALSVHVARRNLSLGATAHYVALTLSLNLPDSFNFLYSPFRVLSCLSTSAPPSRTEVRSIPPTDDF